MIDLKLKVLTSSILLHMKSDFKNTQYRKPPEYKDISRAPIPEIPRSDWRDKYPPKEEVKSYKLEDSADDSILNRMIQLKAFDPTKQIQGQTGSLYYDVSNSQIKFYVNDTIGWVNLANTGIINDFMDYTHFAKIYHAYGGFQNAATTIACTVNTWAWITNGTNNLWTGLEADGFSLSGDIMTVTNGGDYFGHISLAISGGVNEDYFLRCFNITQNAQMGYIIGGTTTGASNYLNLSLPLYLECNAGDTLRMEIKNITNNNDPTVRSAVFYLSYLHD